MNEQGRFNEWFVPKFGPLKFRILVGLLYLPYTGMCISFALMGSMLSPHLLWDRVLAIALIYLMGLGVAAHTADSLGSKKTKPWGNYLSKTQLWIVTLISLFLAYCIGIYYILYSVPLLMVLAVLEGFFVFSYNFELFNGFFHTNLWFAISWGSLPVIAGYIMQTNSISLEAILVSVGAAVLSYIEIKLSRPYKELKRYGTDPLRARKLEGYLKILSLSVIAFTGFIVVTRVIQLP